MESISKWARENSGRWYTSPRNDVFKTRTRDFLIETVDETNQFINIKFRDSKYPLLPLYFWMFERVINHLKKHPKFFVPLGAAMQPPYMKFSVEGAIWAHPFPKVKTKYFVAPNVCDIMALAGSVEYGFARNPDTGRRVQGVKVKEI
jgi:hypothetical protein